MYSRCLTKRRIGGAPPDKVLKVCFLVTRLRRNSLLWWPRMANCFFVLSFGITFIFRLCLCLLQDMGRLRLATVNLLHPLVVGNHTNHHKIYIEMPRKRRWLSQATTAFALSGKVTKKSHILHMDCYRPQSRKDNTFGSVCLFRFVSYVVHTLWVPDCVHHVHAAEWSIFNLLSAAK